MCEHLDFVASVCVNRIETPHGLRFSADVRVECASCHVPLRFIGLPSGIDLNGAAVSVDGTEARLACAPRGEVITQLDECTPAGFTVRRRESESA